MTNNRSLNKNNYPLSRRRFWRCLFREFLSIHGELHGNTQHRLKEISDVPDEVLAEMVPTWTDGDIPEIRDNGLYLAKAKEHESEASVMHCCHTFQGHEKFIVDQFDCGRNIQVISEFLALAANMSEGMAFVKTKNLFVRLCGYGLCRPSAEHSLE